MTSYSNDDKAIWGEFRRDFINSGFRSSEIRQYSAALKTYLYRLQREGMLDEDGPGLQLASICVEDAPTGLTANRPGDFRSKIQRPMANASRAARLLAAPSDPGIRDDSPSEDEDKTVGSSGGHSEVGCTSDI
ncbi:MAG: hypothetical protein M1822_002112, partial [Bathelium mastoideum]